MHKNENYIRMILKDKVVVTRVVIVLVVCIAKF